MDELIINYRLPSDTHCIGTYLKKTVCACVLLLLLLPFPPPHPLFTLALKIQGVQSNSNVKYYFKPSNMAFLSLQQLCSPFHLPLYCTMDPFHFGDFDVSYLCAPDV
jgi:hypothetical protein